MCDYFGSSALTASPGEHWAGQDDKLTSQKKPNLEHLGGEIIPTRANWKTTGRTHLSYSAKTLKKNPQNGRVWDRSYCWVVVTSKGTQGLPENVCWTNVSTSKIYQAWHPWLVYKRVVCLSVCLSTYHLPTYLSTYLPIHATLQFETIWVFT